MIKDRDQRQPAPDPGRRRSAPRPLRGMSEHKLEEELRQLGRDLLNEPVPQQFRDILAAARDRRE